ncbi:hypothetical protein BGZ60DRAFT_400649 [Tricladium varicosporioides]|nr:hypothetical protein BGZ60DRAFT_400649 [Hymenoscyphus varicosporioides]
MLSYKMLLALPALTLLQAIGASASLEDVFFPRSPVPGGNIGVVVDILGARNAGAAIKARAAPSACSFVYSAISYCSSVSPGFLTMSVSKQAPCLCYSSATWVPGVFDGAIATCASYYSTASPTDYSVYHAFEGFCTSAGNVRVASTSASTTSKAATTSGATTAVSTPAITSKATTATATGLAANPGCATVGSSLNSCISATPSFTDLRVSSQAGCLCYQGGSWAPSSFDNNVLSCANYVKTADPSDYSDIVALTSFCSSAGDVSAKATGTAVTVPTAKTTPLTGSSTDTSVSTEVTIGPVVTRTAGSGSSSANPGVATVTAISTNKPSSASGLTGNSMLALISVAVSMLFLF